MVKERKLQTGSSNLSARGSCDMSMSKTMPGSNKKLFQKSYTHKLICPDEYPPAVRSGTHDRHIEKSAIWRPADLYRRDFQTIHRASFLDPQKQKPPTEMAAEKSLAEIDGANRLREKQVTALEQLVLFTKEHYGTSAAMMKRFKKRLGDTITLSEFDAYLKRDQLNNEVSEEVREFAFSAMRANDNGSIDVEQYLKNAEMEEFKDTTYKQEMQHVRHFLARHAAKHMEKTQQEATMNPAQEEHKAKIKSKAIAGEEDLLKKALGQRTFDIDLNHDDTSDLITNIFTNQPLDRSHEEDKYARFLRHSHLDLRAIPFYDLRKDNMDALKAMAVRVDKQLEESDVLEKFSKAAERKWRGTTSIPVSYDHLMPDTYQEFNKSRTLAALELNNSPKSTARRRDSKSMAVSQSMPSLPGLRGHSTDLPAEDSIAATDNTSEGGSLVIHGKPKPKDLTENNRGADIDDPHRTLEDKLSDTGSNDHEKRPTQHMIAANEKKKSHLLSQHKPSVEDFFATAIDGTGPMGRMKDSSKIMRIEKVDSNTLQGTTVGKKVFSDGPTDWGRIGVGGDMDGYADSKSCAARGGVNADRFVTTNSAMYPALIYEPSKPVMRNLISESEKNAEERSRRRNERRARTDANMSVTETRLKYDELNAEIRQLRKTHHKMDRTIKYESATFLNDLKCFKQQPLQRMAKKQIIGLYDKQWGGTGFQRQTVGMVPEQRDFSTTHRASYNLQTLNSSTPSDYAL